MSKPENLKRASKIFFFFMGAVSGVGLDFLFRGEESLSIHLHGGESVRECRFRWSIHGKHIWNIQGFFLDGSSHLMCDEATELTPDVSIGCHCIKPTD